MATTVARLEAVLSADTGRFDRAMDRSSTRMHRVGKVAGITAGVVGGLLAIGLKKSVGEALDAERSQARLQKAYNAVHLSLKPYSRSLRQVEKDSRNLGFQDEEAKDALGSLIVATKNHQKALKDLSVAYDIARFKGVGLDQATKMLTMAMAGSQRAAKQLGISVQPVTDNYDKLKATMGKHISVQEKEQLEAAKLIDKQATAATVIETVRQRVAGQADAYTRTTEGGIKVFQAQMAEMEEQIGKAVLPALKDIVSGLTVIANFFQKHPKLGQAVLVGLAVALAAATTAQIALNLAVLANPYVAATVAVVALAAGVYLLYTRMKQLRPLLEFIFETIVGLPLPIRLLLLAFGGIHGAVEKLNGVFGKLKGLLDDIKAAFQWLIGHAKGIGGFFSGVASKIPGVGDVDPGMFKRMMSGPKSVSPALYDELAGAQGFGLTLTSGYRPGARTKHGTRSDHSYYPSKAIDVAGPPTRMAAFFRWLIGQTDVKQAFYDPLGSIFGGVLSSYREGGHSDHVHVATYDRGGYLKPGWNVAYNGTGMLEPVGWNSRFDPIREINLHIDGQRFFTWFRNEKLKRDRRGDSF